MKKLFSRFLAGLKYGFLGIFIFFILFKPVYAQDLQVDVEIGPRFDPDDQYVITSCMSENWDNIFPLNFVSEYEPQPISADCPKLEIFNNNYEACYLIDIYEIIEPAILLGLFTYAIIHL